MAGGAVEAVVVVAAGSKYSVGTAEVPVWDGSVEAGWAGSVGGESSGGVLVWERRPGGRWL